MAFLTLNQPRVRIPLRTACSNRSTGILSCQLHGGGGEAEAEAAEARVAAAQSQVGGSSVGGGLVGGSGGLRAAVRRDVSGTSAEREGASTPAEAAVGAVFTDVL